ncbi:DnaJ-class molecular chaperone [Streptacidiphilus sp. BW17]|uniref:hypothetical protein n=1 Tax=Streptacidiphilus sp. BW17 TaxID=3156274 RepID=UPI0035179A06
MHNTAADHISAVLVVFFALTTGYALLCAVSPLGRCRRCRGFGFKTRTDRRGRIVRGRNCRRCKGAGRRLRTGRRIYDLAVRLRNEGTPAR